MKLDPSYWSKDKAILNAAFRGFDPNKELPRLLKEAYPELRPFAFGFCTLEFLPQWRSIGWRHLRAEHFPDYESFNESISLRFNLEKDAEGNLKHRENWVMIMPIDFRKSLLKRKQELDEEHYQKTVKPSGRMKQKDGSEDTDFEYQEVKPFAGRKKKRSK